MAKMRSMQHNSRANSAGRVHGTKHNDRDFDTKLADNIDSTLSDQNVYWNCYEDPNLTFTEAELRFYAETFGEQLQRTNDNYLRQSHPERCKSMEEWKQARRNAPEETTLQIGKMEEHVDAETLLACFKEYNQRLEAWNAANGKPFTQLTYALHVDEAVPHIQTRRVWHYADAKGQIKIGQEKALAKAGVALPDPEKPEGKHNNRKMTFDAMTRTMWLDVLKEHGLDIEREAAPDGKHNREKEQMIRDKYQEMVDATERMTGELQDVKEAVGAARSELEELQEDIFMGREEVLNNQELVMAYQLEAEKEAEKVEDIRMEISDLNKQLDGQKAIVVRAMDQIKKLDAGISTMNQRTETARQNMEDLRSQEDALRGAVSFLEDRKKDLEGTILPELEDKVNEAEDRLNTLNQAIRKVDNEGERQWGMSGWDARIKQQQEETKAETKKDLLAKFAEMLIEQFPWVKNLWQQFQQKQKTKTKSKDEGPKHE